MPTDCGCYISQAVTGAIVFCDLHAAAETLLKTLERTRWHLMTKAKKDPQERQIVAEINEVIQQAQATPSAKGQAGATEVPNE